LATFSDFARTFQKDVVGHGKQNCEKKSELMTLYGYAGRFYGNG